MKKIILTLLLCFIPLFINAQTQHYSNNWEKLIWAIEQHESKHIETVKSSNGKYWGCLQISEVLVRECNKIVGHNKYTYADRLNRKKSHEIFNIIQNRYNPKHDFCLAVRLWAVGLSALRNSRAGMQTYHKVMAIYNKL